jgi:hypothetical protein
MLIHSLPEHRRLVTHLGTALATWGTRAWTLPFVGGCIKKLGKEKGGDWEGLRGDKIGLEMTG